MSGPRKALYRLSGLQGAKGPGLVWEKRALRSCSGPGRRVGHDTITVLSEHLLTWSPPAVLGCPRSSSSRASVSVHPSQVSPEMQRDVLRRLFQTDPDVIDYLLRRKLHAVP